MSLISKIIIVLFVLGMMTSWMTQAKKVRMCYFTNWAQYRAGKGAFRPQNIDPSMCTHIIYAFAYVNVDAESLKTVERNDAQFYREIIALKDSNPELKVLLGVGGATHGTWPFETVAKTEEKAERFVQNAIQFLRAHGFDGMDVDWEFPNEGTETLFQRLIQSLSKGFRAEPRDSNTDQLLLTIAVSGNQNTVGKAYKPSEIISYLDYVNLMAYDLWGTWSNTLGHPSPLYAVIPGHAELGRYSVNKVVEEWKKLGTPSSKLVLGIPTYGYSGILSSASQHSPGNYWTTRSGAAGPQTGAAGTLAYYEICDKLKNPDWSMGYIQPGDACYSWNSRTLEYVAYDDLRSVEAKAEYIMDKDLAGAMFWALDFDDFTGQSCQQGKYPLLQEVKNVLDGTHTDDHASGQSNTGVDTTKTKTTTTTTPSPKTTTTTTAKPSAAGSSATSNKGCKPFICSTASGFYPDPSDCSRFYQCAHSVAHRMACPPGLAFDAQQLRCEWPSSAQCHVTC